MGKKYRWKGKHINQSILINQSRSDGSDAFGAEANGFPTVTLLVGVKGFGFAGAAASAVGGAAKATGVCAPCWKGFGCACAGAATFPPPPPPPLKGLFAGGCAAACDG